MSGNRNAEWREEDGFHILYLDYPEERYIIDLQDEDIRKEYFLMDKWEESAFDMLFFPTTIEQAKEFIETDVKNQAIAQKEIEDEMWSEVYEELDKHDKEIDSWKKELKGLINTKRLWEDMNENDYWGIDGIVEIELTDEQRHGYPEHQCARIKDDRYKLYMKCSSDVKYISHYYVWQTTGYIEDDFSGWVLYPLKDGRYLKMNYSC